VNEFGDLPEELPRGDGRVLLVRRFDRTEGGGRVHWEELAQVADRVPGDVPGGQYWGSYEEIAALVGVLAPTDAAALLDRLIFTVSSGDGDAHWKNWGLVYRDRRRAALAPAYDLIPTLLFPRPPRELALTLGGAKRFDEVSRAALIGLAPRIGWTEAQVAQRFDATRARIHAAFEEVADGFRPAEQGRLRDHLGRVWR
jgi:serine/threonine-protein kinase HipA